MLSIVAEKPFSSTL